jgi:hypothetical protein
MLPISIESMRGLKAKKDEDVRRFQVQKMIEMIYALAVDKASTTTETSYAHLCSPYIQHPPEISAQNMAEVIAGLRDLFPGCRVTSSKFIQEFSMTRGLLQPVEVDNIYTFADTTARDYIIVDWS